MVRTDSQKGVNSSIRKLTNYDILTQNYNTHDVAHYLRSKQAPSDIEARQLKALRANAPEETSVLDAEIERLKPRIN